MATKQKKTAKKPATKKPSKPTVQARIKRGRPPKVIPFVDVAAVGVAIERVDLDAIDMRDEKFKFRVNLRVAKLAESMRDNGQQLPVILRRKTGGKLQIVSGFRRITAIRSLGWKTVDAIVRTDIDDDGQAAKVSILENEARQTYNDVDRAYAMLAYRSMGKSNADIEEIFKVGKRQRQRLQDLTTFPKKLQKAVADGVITSTNAVLLMQHVREYGDDELDGWFDWLVKDKPTTAKLTQALREDVAEKREQQPLRLLVRGKDKEGVEHLRIRPIRIDSSLSADDRKVLLSDLKAAIEFVKKL